MKYQHDCQCDLICIEQVCSNRICCKFCFNQSHNNHRLEETSKYLEHTNQKLQQCNTRYKEINQLLGLNRTRRKKVYKWVQKQQEIVESEIQLVEQLTEHKIDIQLSSKPRKEAIQRLTTLISKCKNIRLDELMKQNPEVFRIKEEQVVNNEQATDQIKYLSDQLYLAEDKDKEKHTGSMSPGQVTSKLRHLNDSWDTQLKKIMGFNKRFQKRMLKLSRMSIEDAKNISCIEVQLPQLQQVNQILQLTENIIITIHPSQLQLWKYNNNTYQEFKAIAAMNLEYLKNVVMSPQRKEFIVLHEKQTVWSLCYIKDSLQLKRVFICPIKSIKLTQLLVTPCESMLLASGGSKQKGYCIICWNYQNGKLIRIIRKQYSFPNEGQLLFNQFHLFRSNKNSVDVFSFMNGQMMQTINLKKSKQYIENIAILRRFYNKSALAISTNTKSFYIYTLSRQEQIYKLIYENESLQPSNSSVQLFHQPDLAEQGFFQIYYENGESYFVFNTMNKKILFSLLIKDEYKCASVVAKRSPFKVQLSFLIGFQSGFLRVINIIN